MVPIVVLASLTAGHLYERFVKAVFILLVSFTLSHFHKSSPTLLQEIYFLPFHMPKK